MRQGLRMLLLAAATAVLAGCSEQPTQAPAAELVWPPPPQVPRVRYLQALSTPEHAGVRRTWFQRMVTFIEGAPTRRLSSPHGLFKDAAGRLYIVDTFNKAVFVIDPAAADSYWFPDEPIDGFENPIGIVADEKGRVFVTDSKTAVVHVFEDRGRRYLRAIGEGILSRPTDLAIDPANGDLLVVDTLAKQIVAFGAEDLRAKEFIGREGRAAGSFNYPTNIVIAGDGALYVTDSMNFRIQKLGPDRTFLRSFGGPGDAPGYFSRPKGLATDSDGHVYVVDALFDNVQVFDSQGRLLLAFGSPGSGPGNFWLPNEIFIDAEDRIYVSDSYNKRLQVFQYLKQGDGQ